MVDNHSHHPRSKIRFDVRLGRATTAPPASPWQGGVWRRNFEHGTALVNPTEASVTVDLETGFKRIKGTQAPTVNDGRPARDIVLGAKDGLILLRE